MLRKFRLSVGDGEHLLQRPHRVRGHAVGAATVNRPSLATSRGQGHARLTVTLKVKFADFELIAAERYIDGRRELESVSAALKALFPPESRQVARRLDFRILRRKKRYPRANCLGALD
jgi:hypothetical protein